MKWIAIAIMIIFVPGCTITVSPIKPMKKYKYASKSKSKRSASRSSTGPKIAPPPSRYQIKDAQWVEDYHKLQDEHGGYTIQDDANIEPLPDGRFKVPQAVITHQQDLLLAKPTPP